jgi:hypothetical protein
VISAKQTSKDKNLGEIPSTQTQLYHKYHHHGGVVCPSYGVGSMDLFDGTVDGLVA